MVKEPPLYSSEPLRSPEAAVKVIADMLRQYDREAFCIVNLRNDLSPINMNIVSTGTLNASLAHPREILKSAVLSNPGYRTQHFPEAGCAEMIEKGIGISGADT